MKGLPNRKFGGNKPTESIVVAEWGENACVYTFTVPGPFSVAIFKKLGSGEAFKIWVFR
ncbi:unnamed protein product, partial [Allacma fusca]